ncbi:PREDICTED: protein DETOXIFICATION 42-like [Nelumbo nucifera]|uniref:Protein DETOXIFICATION n=1 Tax=Nelumbo nucifera TaxID=4432 RepID=A0A1U8Q421_NELNU|nr:PREDICTED: protein DETOXIFICATION 42-like [Nelumbo nucifera]
MGSLVFKKDDLGKEIARIAIPAALALAADPIASLIDTAVIGHLGPVQIAAVGVSIALFNQVSRITVFPIVCVTTSSVAEEDAVEEVTVEKEGQDLEKRLANNYQSSTIDTETTVRVEEQESDHNVETHTINSEMTYENTSGKQVNVQEQENENLDKDLVVSNDRKDSQFDSDRTVDNPPSTTSGNSSMSKCENKRKNIPSASTALVVGGVLGLLQTMLPIFAAKPLLKFMGVHSDSPMLRPARQYLTLRSLGAPVILLSLAMQGVFRGFKDTKTPLYATVAGDVSNIILDPVFMFVFHMGVSGAAIAHVISQYLISVILLWRLMQKVELLPPSIKDLQFSRFLKNGGLLLARVIAVTFCQTLAASLSARHGSTPMAAFQVCYEIWLATSLLSDGLAVSILASAFARKDYRKAIAATSRVLQLGLVLGLVLAVGLGIGLPFAARLFTKDNNVLHLIIIGTPFVAATQPINTLAFVLDGVNFGLSDFAYCAYSMVVVAMMSIPCLFVLSSSNGFVGIWVALTIYMTLRALAGVWRVGTGTGPWHFLRN